MRIRDLKNLAEANLLRDEEGGALVEYVIALSFATMTAVFAMYAVGKPLMDHFFFAYSLAVQPM